MTDEAAAVLVEDARYVLGTLAFEGAALLRWSWRFSGTSADGRGAMALVLRAPLAQMSVIFAA